MLSISRFTALYLLITMMLLVAGGGTVQAESTGSVALFRAYPGLQKKIHHTPLGTFPTPVTKLEDLGIVIDAPGLYLKNDSKSGPLFGGNKVRKLEFLLGEALAFDATGVLTIGCAGSNHTTATAAYCSQLGLRCVCVHIPQEPTFYAQRNLLLSHHFGAELIYCHSRGLRDKTMANKNQEFINQTGMPLYLIPSGGSNEIGTLGFVNAAFELKEQVQAGVLPEPDVIYVAMGSTGTAAGLILGLKAAGLKTTVVPVAVEPESFAGEFKQKLVELINKAAVLLYAADKKFPNISLTTDDVSINQNFVGAGYALISPEAREAIEILLIANDIKLDGTYTSKAFAALLTDVANNPALRTKTILFWDSFCAGDFAEITKNIDYHVLPKNYHLYFNYPIQPDDKGV